MLDTKALAAAMAPVIQEAVAKAVSAAEAPLLKRIDALEKRQPEKGDPGEPGPAGKDGVNGLDGTPGADGRDGADGKDGTDGKDADMEALKRHLEELVSALPVPQTGRDGVDGKDGRDGEAGAPGERGLDGKDGRDGVGLAGALIDRSGNLILTLSDGTTRDLGMVIGKDGRDGADGRNGERGPEGFSLKDFDTEFRHSDKTLVLKFASGDTLETHEIFLPYVRDCGVWKAGSEYLEGDGVTWGGSFWTAQKATSGKPDEGDWRLAVKRGRDGKDFAGPQPKAPVTVKV